MMLFFFDVRGDLMVVVLITEGTKVVVGSGWWQWVLWLLCLVFSFWFLFFFFFFLVVVVVAVVA